MSTFAAELVVLNLSAEDKDAAIQALIAVAASAGRVTDVDQVLADVRAREEVMSTGLEGGLAIPHARTAGVATATVVVGKPSAPIDFGAEDGPAHLVFLILAPADGNDEHLAILSELARRLIYPEFTSALLSATSPEHVVELLQSERNQP
jgi:fructose-specific phosphotransferase system IIA component